LFGFLFPNRFYLVGILNLCAVKPAKIAIFEFSSYASIPEQIKMGKYYWINEKKIDNTTIITTLKIPHSPLIPVVSTPKNIEEIEIGKLTWILTQPFLHHQS
jgi:hypothetical protein